MLKIRFDQSDKQLIENLKAQNRRLMADIADTRILTGRLFAHEIRNAGRLAKLGEAEFKVFSQWGDDGIIQYLVNRLDIPVKKFIEFGVENYTEANTRFLLLNDNWSGLVMDCSEENVAYIQKRRHLLEARPDRDLRLRDGRKHQRQLCRCRLFRARSACCTSTSTAPTTGSGRRSRSSARSSPSSSTTACSARSGPSPFPTLPAFSRFDAHHSGIYAGASLAALCDLAEEKGYAFVGSNSAGNNAYFVRKDRLGDLPALSAEEGYVASKFREHRDERGA